MKLVEIVARAGNLDTINAILERHEVRILDAPESDECERATYRLLVADEGLQALLDALATITGDESGDIILIAPLEAVVPRPPEAERKREDAASTTREALYEEVEKGAQFDRNFLVLVVLSTIVAAIGLLEDNVAAVIGAMVIAPLLGPNLALGLGTALGDLALIRKAMVTGTSGMVVVLALSMLLSQLDIGSLHNPQILSRAEVKLDSLALALASGGAAAMALTSGLPTVLTGVMVAVALLPPTVVVGLTLGNGAYDLAAGATLLLTANIVCVNLATKIVFLVQGIKPRRWAERQHAKRAMTIYLGLWLVTLVVLAAIIVLRAR